MSRLEYYSSCMQSCAALLSVTVALMVIPWMFKNLGDYPYLAIYVILGLAAVILTRTILICQIELFPNSPPDPRDPHFLTFFLSLILPGICAVVILSVAFLSFREGGIW
jgi:hypothetical protein